MIDALEIACDSALQAFPRFEPIDLRIPKVRIVSRRNGVGLDRDVELLRQALPIDVEIETHSTRSLSSLRSFIHRGSNRNGPLNVLVERIPLTWSLADGTSVLIPNQERFPKRDLPRLNRVDAVLCKSRHAEQIFRRYAKNTRYVGFTSVDRKLDGTKPDYRRFLHLAGRSTLKGTSTVLELWRSHPEWPTLTLVQHSQNSDLGNVPPNVRLIDQYLDDTTLRTIQNEHGINVCPSLSEGWGHYIVEGMSCQSVVITTDAPPMNELIDATRGFVVPWTHSAPRHLGTNYTIDKSALESTINEVIRTSESTLQRIGTAARAWYNQNQDEFHCRASSAFETLLNRRI